MTKLLFLLVLTGAAFAQDCPVKVINVYKSEIQTQGSLLNLTLQSTSAKEIKEANFAVTVLDSAGQPHALIGAFDSGKIKAGTKKHKSYVMGREVLDPFTRVKFQAWTNDVQFADGTTWKDDGTHACFMQTK